jgi:translocation protein SEC63
MVILWGVSALLVLYISLTSEEVKVFDPYAVLQIPVGSEHAAIKKAYRALSLQYHPDKNPDPAANVFFTEHLTPAYKALTDPVARENYAKYGHPDGKQSVKLGIALPSWVGSGRNRPKHPSSITLASRAPGSVS